MSGFKDEPVAAKKQRWPYTPIHSLCHQNQQILNHQLLREPRGSGQELKAGCRDTTIHQKIFTARNKGAEHRGGKGASLELQA